MANLNWNKESKVFIPSDKNLLSISNQKQYRVHFLSDLLNQQVKQNGELKLKLDTIMNNGHQQHLSQSEKFEQILQELHLKFGKFDNQLQVNEVILSNLENLNEHSQSLNVKLLNEQHMNQAILDQLQYQEKQSRQSNERIENLVTLTNNLSQHLDNNERNTSELKMNLQLQDVYHKTVMERLDKQQALIEKFNTQLDGLMSMIFERTQFILEKLDQSFQATTAYISEALTKTGFMKPFLLSRKPKDKTKIRN